MRKLNKKKRDSSEIQLDRNGRIADEQLRKMIATDSYRSAMEIAKRYTRGKSPEEKKMWLDYMLDCVLNDICASTIVKPIIDPTGSGMLQRPFPIGYSDENGTSYIIKASGHCEIDLSKVKVYVCPWDSKSAEKALIDVAENGFRFDENNHTAVYYSDINLCYIGNGHHHVNAARYLKNRKANLQQPTEPLIAEVSDLTLLYPHYYTDGMYWYNAHTEEKIQGDSANVGDFRFAIAYGLAKFRYEEGLA